MGRAQEILFCNPMHLRVKVIPSARKNLLKQEGLLTKIYLNAPALNGKANQGLVAFLAEHYQVKARHIEIIKGLKSPHKIVNIGTI